MRAARWTATALVFAGCGLLGSNGISYDYSFDPNEFVLNLGSGAAGMVPSVPCSTDAACAQVPPPSFPGGQATMFCDASMHCAARIEVRKSLPIDLRNAMTPVPAEVVQFGINLVELKKIDYWVEVGKNTLNVPTPSVDLYVAPQSAVDEHDAQAKHLGAVGSLPAMSNQCSDAKDSQPTAQAQGKTVCLIPLDPDGTVALGQFVKNFKTSPFEIIAHTVILVAAGQQVPSGALDFWLQPTVSFSILK